MFQNNNGAIIRRLAGRKLCADRRRNWIAVLTIAITAILFTAPLTTGACTIETQQYYALHQTGTMAHATLHSITKEQYNKIKENPSVHEIGYKLPVADSVDNPGLSEWPVTMSYMDDTALRMSLSQPVMGKKPQAENEIAADAGTLDRLGIPCRVGAQVPVAYTFGGEKEEAVFILSGWCQSEPRLQKGFIAVPKSVVLIPVSTSPMEFISQRDCMHSLLTAVITGTISSLQTTSSAMLMRHTASLMALRI